MLQKSLEGKTANLVFLIMIQKVENAKTSVFTRSFCYGSGTEMCEKLFCILHMKERNG
jgi:hypothetical protein